MFVRARVWVMLVAGLAVLSTSCGDDDQSSQPIWTGDDAGPKDGGNTSTADSSTEPPQKPDETPSTDTPKDPVMEAPKPNCTPARSEEPVPARSEVVSAAAEPPMDEPQF